MRPFTLLLFAAMALIAPAPVLAWDSQDGNPTHATHSYHTEYAINQLKAKYPEVAIYEDELVDGANREIHDLVMDDPEQEELRGLVRGNNWACEAPEELWTLAIKRYFRGDKAKAYWYLGIILHYVEDMGVPAHGLHVYHQSSPSDWDNFEVMALQQWDPRYGAINRSDPRFGSPADYLVFSGEWSAADFEETWPGVEYTTDFYSTSWLWASEKEKTFMRNRQGRTATCTTWALWSGLRGFHRRS